MASVDVKDELNCSVCLNIFSDPVMLSCGHNFCRACIGNVLDTQDGAGVYTCPECRAEFTERPALQRNMKLCNIAEHFLTAQPEKEDSGIFCTYCIDAPVPAAKTCLLCEASLCDRHLSVHSKSTGHVLTEPISSMENRKCSVHKEALKYYCPQDAVCVCVSCIAFGEHRGHQVCSMDEAMEKKKEKMRNALDKMISKREETEKRVQSLQEKTIKVRDKSSFVTERINTVFKHLQVQQAPAEKQVLSEISRQEEQVTLRASDLIQQMETKKEELSQKASQLKDMCKETDPLKVLQGRESNRADFTYNVEEDDKERATYNQTSTGVGDLDEVLISLTLHRALASIIANLTTKSGFHVPTASDVLLDVYSAANNVSVTSDLKMASKSNEKHKRAEHIKRFPNHQVFSIRTFLSGKHYWEVETSNDGCIRVGLSYPSIDMKGQNDNPYIGNNKKSWCLTMKDKVYEVMHDSHVYKLHTVPTSHMFGIYLDYDAGRLSFYELCVPVKHLCTFTTTFTEPLHASICIVEKGWVRIMS